MQVITKYTLLLFILALVSCFEEDTPVEPWPGEVTTIPEDIETYFSYFDFESGEIVASYPANSWQIGFECGSDGWHIQINSGDNWFLWNSYQNDFEADIEPPQSVLWSFDKQSAYSDSTAAGNWVIITDETYTYTKHIYFLGKYIGGNYFNVQRLQFIQVDDKQYNFLQRDEKSGITDTVIITKSELCNYIYYNILSRQMIEIEPRKEDFDIIFGPYYDLATQFGVTIPYLVRGTFINSWQTTAVLDSINDYDRINFEMLDEYVFSGQKDVIGYRWKDIIVDPDSGTAQYKVKPHYNYIIHTSSDKYYKLRFLSFSIDGVSGYPRFEYKELKPLQ